MAHFAGNFNWEDGVLWDIVFQGDETEEGRGQAPLYSCVGLVDTGASITCIAPVVVDQLKLHSRGKFPMQTAQALVEANLYHVSVAAVFGPAEGPQEGPPQVTLDLLVAAFDPGNHPYQALIGRDILRLGLLVLSRDGLYHFEY